MAGIVLEKGKTIYSYGQPDGSKLADKVIAEYCIASDYQR